MPSTRSRRPSTPQIHTAFVAALAEVCLNKPAQPELARKPLDLRLAPPLPRAVRAYLYSADNPLGERSVGDYKIELTLPGQRRSQRGSLDHLSGVATLLAGWAFAFDVWVLWDAGLHDEFAFSTNVQVKSATVYQAAAQGSALQVKRLRGHGGRTETVVAAHSSVLADAVGERLRLTAERLAAGEQ